VISVRGETARTGHVLRGRRTAGRGCFPRQLAVQRCLERRRDREVPVRARDLRVRRDDRCVLRRHVTHCSPRSQSPRTHLPAAASSSL
jgi:hypothetical protein